MDAFLLALAALLLYDLFMIGKHLAGVTVMRRLSSLHVPIVLAVGIAYAFLVRKDLLLQPYAAIGALFIVLGFAIALAAFLSLKAQAVRPGKLVTGGIYGRVRNPMYSGILLAIIGTAFIAPTQRIIVFILILAFSFLAIVKAEERELKKRFGKPYEAYCCRVPALFPRLRRWS